MSCAEIRRLFWQLVLAASRKAAAILHWSQWRRWHQAWARYFHYRRRHNSTSDSPPETAEQVATPQMNLIDVLWSRLQPLLPPVQCVGRPYDHDRRLVLEAIDHVMQTDCGWRNLPTHFPPWQTVYAQLRQWQKTGIWDKIWSGLDQAHSKE